MNKKEADSTGPRSSNPDRVAVAAGMGPETIAVVGSKGGVGKSNLVANLAVCLGRWGRRVLLVDGDLGLANLDVLLGLDPRHTVAHLLRGDVELTDVLLDGPPGVRVLPGASGVPDLARFDETTRLRFLDSLRRGASLVDDVLIDTGAGLGEATLALQRAASRVLLVTTPEPTARVDAYATLKVLWDADPEKCVDVVVNAADDDDDAAQVYERIAEAASRFLGRKPGFLGAVYRDERVGEAVRRQRSVVELFPDSPAALCYERIALRLSSRHATGSPAAEFWERLITPIAMELPH